MSLGRAIQLQNGFYDAGALIWLSVTFACLLAALVPARGAGGRSRRYRALPVIVLALGLIWQFATLISSRPAMYIEFEHPSDEPTFFRMLIAAATLSIGVLLGRRRPRQVAFLLVLVLHFALGAWMLRASPKPRIDVVTVHREAIDALGHGRSPYSITFENIYGHERFYAAGLTAGGRVLFGLPYPPLSLLMAAPGHWLAGDYRYALLAALTSSGALIAFCGWRRRGEDAAILERQACLAALLLLFTPRVFFELEQGWTEPFAVLLLAATVFAAAGESRLSGPIAGLLVAVKQYLVLSVPLLFLLFGRHFTWRQAGIAVATATAVTLPFFLWDPAGFLNSVVLLQFAEPFRRDSLSYLSWMVRNGFDPPGVWITIVAACAAIALGMWRLPRTPAGFAAAVALVTMASFAFGKKAFCNYYFLVIAALVIAVGAAADDRSPDP